MNKYEIKLSFNIIGSIVHQQRLLNEIEYYLKHSSSLADDGQHATNIDSELLAIQSEYTPNESN